MNAVYDRLSAYTIVVLGKRLGSNVGGPFIDILISLIPTILPMILACFAPKPAAAAANNPGLLLRWHLRREIAKVVPGDDAESIALRGHVFEALLAAGKTVTTEDMDAVAAGA